MSTATSEPTPAILKRKAPPSGSKPILKKPKDDSSASDGMIETARDILQNRPYAGAAVTFSTVVEIVKLRNILNPEPDPKTPIPPPIQKQLNELKAATAQLRQEKDAKQAARRARNRAASASASAAADADAPVPATSLPRTALDEANIQKAMKYPTDVKVRILCVDPETKARSTFEYFLYPQLVLFEDAPAESRDAFDKRYEGMSASLRPEPLAILWMLYCAECHIRACGLTDVYAPTLKWVEWWPLAKESVTRRVEELESIAAIHSRNSFSINIRVFTLAVKRILLKRAVAPKKIDSAALEAAGESAKGYHLHMESRAYGRFLNHMRDPMPRWVRMYAHLYPSDHSYWTDDEEIDQIKK